MEFLAQINLGALLLSIAIVLGLFGVVVFLIRLMQIPLSHYLGNRKNNKNMEKKLVKGIETKGF